MNITDIRVRLLNTESRLRAVCSITIDDQIVLHDIRIIESEEGLFFAMPSKKLKNGSYRDICHPINQEARNELEELIFNAYHKELELSDDGANSSEHYEDE